MNEKNFKGQAIVHERDIQTDLAILKLTHYENLPKIKDIDNINIMVCLIHPKILKGHQNHFL
jgi:hypothetical protein